MGFQQLDDESLRLLRLIVRDYIRENRTPGRTALDYRDDASPVSHAKITAVAAINGRIRWKYTIEIGHFDMSTSPATGGTWVADTTGTIYAYSLAEDMNTFTSGTGAIGTGNTSVAQTDGNINSTGCKIVSLPVNGFVAVMPRGVDSATGQIYYSILNFANSSQN